MTTPLRLAVIIGSTREGRVGDRIGRWFLSEAQRRPGIEADLIDLANYDFPPGFPGRPTAQIDEFLGQIRAAEAFVVVTPEYNHSFPASLKQAIDYAYDEWQAKPVGFVSYGCRSTGLHAVDQLRTVFTALHVVTMRDGVGLDLLADGSQLDVDGLLALQGPAHAASLLLDQLSWWGLGLREARLARPYVS